MDTYTMPIDMNSGIHAKIGVIVIGRNEGQRLVGCLKSLSLYSQRTIYVDSGSSDGSIEAAALLCAGVVFLDLDIPLTAARARNAGFDALMKIWPDTTFVQFLDGDCEMDAAWINAATAFLSIHKELALVFGRRRERHSRLTVFNAMCDREWDGKAGEVIACGGDILIRADALQSVGGYSNHLIAGEEPELCVRLRERGWKLWRLPLEMTRHDANMSRLSQWWRRAVRCGHAYAQVASIHRRSPFQIWSRNFWRAVFWAGAIPLAAIGGLAIHPASLLLLLAYPLQVVRLANRSPRGTSYRWSFAFFDTLGKFPEMQGIAQYYINALIGRQQKIIEYK